MDPGRDTETVQRSVLSTTVMARNHVGRRGARRPRCVCCVQKKPTENDAGDGLAAACTAPKPKPALLGSAGTGNADMASVASVASAFMATTAGMVTTAGMTTAGSEGGEGNEGSEGSEGSADGSPARREACTAACRVVLSPPLCAFASQPVAVPNSPSPHPSPRCILAASTPPHRSTASLGATVVRTAGFETPPTRPPHASPAPGTPAGLPPLVLNVSPLLALPTVSPRTPRSQPGRVRPSALRSLRTPQWHDDSADVSGDWDSWVAAYASQDSAFSTSPARPRDCLSPRRTWTLLLGDAVRPCNL